MRLIRRLPGLDLLIIAGLFALPLAFFWQVTLGNRTLLPADNLYQFQPWAAYREQQGVPAVPHNSLLSDLVLENLPWKQFIRQSIANHELPLWNPYIFAGTPFLAEGQHSALYPFSVIYYVMPLDKAYGWFTVSQIWLAGLFMYLFMRGLGIGKFGATIAAIAYQMSGFFIASVVFQMIIAGAAWLPFMLLMVEFTFRRRALFGKPAAIPWIALGAVGLGCVILAGHVEIIYYTLLIMSFWAACRLGVMAWHAWRSGILRGVWRQKLLTPALSLISLVVLGLGIGSIQFIPLLELASHNFRAGSASFAEVRSYAFPPRHALAFLTPNLYGSPAQHDYTDVFTGQSVAFSWQRGDGSSVTDTYWEVGKNYVEGACYVGLLTLFLAAIALLNARYEKAPHAKIETVAPYRAMLAALAVISVLFIFGTPFYAILYYGLPGINQLHSPFRWVFPLTLCLAALAGFGAEALQRARGESTFGAEYWRSGAAKSFTFRLAKRFGYVLIGIGAALLAILVLSRVFFEKLHGPLDALFHKLAGAADAFPNVETFYSVEFRPILFFGLFLVACGCVIRVSRCPIYTPRWLGRRPIWMLMALVILTLDLVVASAGFNPAADPAWLKFEPPAITWLKQHDPTQWRFAAVEGPTKTMNANVGWLYGLQDIAGYDSIIPKQYVDYVQYYQPQDQLLYNRIASLPHNSLSGGHTQWVGSLSVKYLIAENEMDVSRSGSIREPGYKYGVGSWFYSTGQIYQKAYQDKSVVIYENIDASWFSSRAYTISTILRKQDQTQCVGMPASDGYVMGGSKEPPKIVEALANQVVIDTVIPGDPNVDPGAAPGANTEGFVGSCLILNDSYFPGWRAYIKPQGAADNQEKEVPIIPYGISRAVYLHPGAWTVRFRYSPPSFQIGAFTTFIAAVVIVFAMLLWLWQTFYREDTSEGVGVRRVAKNSVAPIALNLFNRAIDFSFAAIMLRVLGPADAGVYYYAVVVFGWFDTITNFGLNLLLTREVARDRASAGRYLLNSTALRLLLAAGGVPFLAIFLLIHHYTMQPADIPFEPVTIAAIVLLYVGLVPNSISYGLTALFYAFEQAEVPAATSTVSAILKAVFGVGALLAGWGVVGLAGVSILLNLITLAILSIQARTLIANHVTLDPVDSITNLLPTGSPSPFAERGSGGEVNPPLTPDPFPPRKRRERGIAQENGLQPQGPFQLDRALIRDMVIASWPLMLNNLLSSLFFKIDVTLLDPMKGNVVVGQYSTAYKYIDALGLIPSLFTMALLPIMSRQAAEDKPGLQRSYFFAIKLLVGLALPMAVMMTFIAPMLVGLLGGGEFLPAGGYALQLMIWFAPFGWINSVTNYVLIALNQQRPMRWAFVAGVSFNIVANLLLIPIGSYAAAAIITILSEIVLQIAFYRLLRSSLGPVPYIALFWKPVFAALLMVPVMLVLWPVSWIVALIASGVIYLGAFAVLRPFSGWEMERIAALLPNAVRRFVVVQPSV